MTTKSKVSLKGEFVFWKLAWKLIAARCPSKNRTHGENSVSKICLKFNVERYEKSFKVDKTIRVA